ncbi:MAG: hypothetical protein JNL58_19460 [Planctomyces sp.]|nr:hypothetical protein [Planctomyces sp.]
MARSSDSAELQSCWRDLLGYLNFSHGAPNSRFRGCLNTIFRELGTNATPALLRDEALRLLEQFRQDQEPAFSEITQAKAAIVLTLDHLLPAYRSHHSDLLAHLQDADFFNPFLIARMFEAVLEHGEPWTTEPRAETITASLSRLNFFVGYRPAAVLENGRRAEVYDHERFCPVPLYFKDVGSATGRYEDIIDATIAFMKQLPDDLTVPAHFSFERMAELCVDVRAHDHLHPVNKRTNYVFGEWDPEDIDTKGFFRRFVIRKLILDSLVSWIESEEPKQREQRLGDASAVLCGTILMASAISGSGPQTYDSGVSLTTLLPIVARQRDSFYQQLLDSTKGERGKRLRQLAKQSRQPFGHVRHELNMQLAKYGADQVQHRHLSWMYATMGFEAASCEEASVIPCVSARFESDIQSRLVTIRRDARAGKLKSAQELLTEVIGLLHRGIRCGAIIDPWNILGFQGQFPLFFAREDSIPDNRVEVLLELMEQIFDICALIMTEAAASGQSAIHDSVLMQFQSLAEEWDRYATTTVNDLTHIHGMQSVRAAQMVAQALTEWRTSDRSVADMSIWRRHAESFDVTSCFAQVVSSLLERKEHIAAMGLLMQWLSRADSVRLENGGHSIHTLLNRLVNSVCFDQDTTNRWTMLRRLFAFMEANAGPFWNVPTLSEFADTRRKNQGPSADQPGDEGDALDLHNLFDSGDAPDDDESALYGASRDGVTYRDSTDDGNVGDTIDEGSAPGTTEFEVLYRHIEPRLKFLHTVGSLWGLAAVSISRLTVSDFVIDDSIKVHLREWLGTIRKILDGLGDLVQEVRDFEITTFSADLEANLEYDVQLQCRFLLMQNVLSTTVEFLMAERMIGAVLAEVPTRDKESRSLDHHLSLMLSAIFTRDPDGVQACFGPLCQELKKRPLLYVPFENGGHPATILKARTLQALIRTMLSQLPRLGLLEETFQLLQIALQMEKTARPLGQAVTEFDRLYRTGLSCSVEAIMHSASRWKTRANFPLDNVFKRIQKLLDSYTELWIRHSGSMRLSVIEDLHDDQRAEEVRDFITQYGEDLFHTRMLTLGNARAIVHHGAEALLEELETNVAPFQRVKLLEDIEQGVIDRDDAIDLAEFVYEAVVDNFERFLEYNTTTTYSDYGNRLYCLLDFVRLEALYDRFDWNTLPWQIAYETLVRVNADDLADFVEAYLLDETAELAESFVDELKNLENEYGVRLPTLHDHVCERIIGALTQNRMVAMVSRCLPKAGQITEEEAAQNFEVLRQQIDAYMSERIGSGIEAPEWMQRIAGELDRVQEFRNNSLMESLHEGDFTTIPARVLDKQLTAIARRSNDPGSRRRP